MGARSGAGDRHESRANRTNQAKQIHADSTTAHAASPGTHVETEHCQQHHYREKN